MGVMVGKLHPDGILLDKYGYRIVFEADSRMNARLSSVISGRDWHWLPYRSENMLNVQSLLSCVRRTCLCGCRLRIRFSLVRTLERLSIGSNLEWNRVILFGILFLSLSMLSFYGLLLRIAQLLMIKC
jgi:hypothetical protein